MADEAALKLTFRLSSADDRPADPMVLDDIIRLIRQAHLTAPKDVLAVNEPADGFRVPGDADGRMLRGLVFRIESRVQQSSAGSQAVVDKWSQTASQPDGPVKIAEGAVIAAQYVVGVVQSALIRRIAVTVAEDPAT